MLLDIRSVISDEFNGFDEGNIFRLDNGLIFQQAAYFYHYHYHYHYAYRPRAHIFLKNGQKMIVVEGLQFEVPVVEIEIVKEGHIVSDFKGYEGSSQFQFEDGSVWQQAEYKYHYHYAYRPEAFIAQELGGLKLHVDGIDDPVLVRRLR